MAKINPPEKESNINICVYIKFVKTSNQYYDFKDIFFHIEISNLKCGVWVDGVSGYPQISSPLKNTKIYFSVKM